jgi:hypothetical protein
MPEGPGSEGVLVMTPLLGKYQFETNRSFQERYHFESFLSKINLHECDRRHGETSEHDVLFEVRQDFISLDERPIIMLKW